MSGFYINVVHNWRKSKHPSGEYSIHLRVNQNGNTIYLKIMEDSISQKYSTRYWTGQADHLITENHPSGFEINQLLRAEINKIWSFITKQKAHHNRSVSLDDIREAYYKKSKYELSFNEYLQLYIREAKHLEYRTIQVYKSFQNHINKFKPSLQWLDITPTFIDAFNRYLQNDLRLRGASRKKYFDKFRVTYSEGCKQLQIDFGYIILVGHFSIVESQ